MPKALAAIAALCLTALAGAVRADGFDEQPVRHGPFQPEVQDKVRSFVLGLAANFGEFYPHAEFRHVRAVYFDSGAIIVCGEMNRTSDVGAKLGWRYFSNSGPLIFESTKLEILCDQRTYVQPAFSDDTEYAPAFATAARGGRPSIPTAG